MTPILAGTEIFMGKCCIEKEGFACILHSPSPKKRAMYIKS